MDDRIIRVGIACVVFAIAPAILRGATSSPMPGEPDRVLQDPLVGIVDTPTGISLVRLTPVPLTAAGREVPLGEYHWTAALSPDGTRLALSTGGPRGGVHILSVPQLEEIHRVHPGIAAEALAWLSPTRVAAALLCNQRNRRGGCAVVVIDADIGRVIRRWPESDTDLDSLPVQPPLGDVPKPVAVTPRGAVFLLAHVSAVAPARLVLVTPGGEVHAKELSRIPLGVPASGSVFDQATGGMATDARGDRVFVLGNGNTLAEIALEGLEVRYRVIDGLSDSGWRKRQLTRIDDRYFAAHGEQNEWSSAGSTEPPAREGVSVIDIFTDRAITIDRQADKAVVAAGTVLTYGGYAAGIAGYNAEGTRRFHVLEDELLPQERVSAHVIDGRVYVSFIKGGTTRVAVVNAATGVVEHLSSTPWALVDLIGSRAAATRLGENAQEQPGRRSPDF